MPYEKIGKNEPVCIADEVPFEIPESWEWVRFKNLVFYSMGKTPPRKESEYWTEPVYPWVSIADMNADSTILSTKELVNEYAAEKTFRKRISKAGTLLMSFKLTVGKVSLLGIDAYHNEAIISIYPFVDNNAIITNYLFCILPLISQSGQTKTAIKGNTLNSESLDALLIPLPPLKEQERICKRLNDLKAKLSVYNKTYDETTLLNECFPTRLKKSLLQYAVQGKLVPQDPTDEPASILLDRIHAEKEQLIKSGKIKRDKHESVIFRRDNSYYERVDGIERCIDDEIPFEIPDSWEWVRLGSLFQVNPRNNLSDNTDAGFIPMPLLAGGFQSHHDFEVKKWGDIKKGFTHFADGDIVIAKITPCFQNRKSAVIENLPNHVGAGTTELYVLRDNSKLLFMQYFLLICKTHAFIELGMKHFSGTAGQQRVGKDFVCNYLIPVPPIKEQYRIVENVNKIIQKVTW